jgi:hypothetical protein
MYDPFRQLAVVEMKESIRHRNDPDMMYFLRFLRRRMINDRCFAMLQQMRSVGYDQRFMVLAPTVQ